MSDDNSLAAIVALARAGATEHALRRLHGREPDVAGSAFLTVKGRLLKDLAASRRGDGRTQLLKEAAAAYEQAAAVAPASYPLINAATLYFVTGAEAKACSLAQATLALLDARPDEPETPYFSSATRAEALLLLDRHDRARAAFAEAIALSPSAWEDHASTLRQFALILAAQGRKAHWLDAYRPPRSLQFGGHMSFDPTVVHREQVDQKIAAALEVERIGFGYGALAAGADIIIAEALIARGADLHAVLPGGADAFAAVSVDPFGRAWRRRFEALVERARTVRAVRPLDVPPDRMMIDLADEVAMGAAAMNARRLESSALQLLVVPDKPSTGDGTSANAHEHWAQAGWRQRIIAAPRERLDSGKPPRLPSAPHARLAILTIGVGADGGAEDRLRVLAQRLGKGAAPALGPYFTGRETVVGYSEAAAAAQVAIGLADTTGGGIGGHYGIADPIADPFSGGLRVVGEPAALAFAAAASSPPGAVCVTADFAAALAAAREKRIYSELVGELDTADGGEPVELYALKPRL